MSLTGFRFITIRYWVTLSTQLHHVCYDTHAVVCFDNFNLLYWFMDLFISLPFARSISPMISIFQKWKYTPNNDFDRQFILIQSLICSWLDAIYLISRKIAIPFAVSHIFPFSHLLIKNIIFKFSHLQSLSVHFFLNYVLALQFNARSYITVSFICVYY